MKNPRVREKHVRTSSSLRAVALSAGERLCLERGADLALVLKGEVTFADPTSGRPAFESPWVTHNGMPTVFRARDCQRFHVIALSEVLLVAMTLPACRDLMAGSKSFRTLFLKATEMRLRALIDYRMSAERPIYVH